MLLAGLLVTVITALKWRSSLELAHDMIVSSDYEKSTRVQFLFQSLSGLQIWNFLCRVFPLINLHESLYPVCALHLPQKQKEINPSVLLSLLLAVSLSLPRALSLSSYWHSYMKSDITKASNIRYHLVLTVHFFAFSLPIREFQVRASTTSEVSLRSLWSPAVTCRRSLALSSLRLRYKQI